MKTITIPTAKLTVVFRPGELPKIDPAKPVFVLRLGAHEIHGQINAKAARKLANHAGGAVLGGRLVDEHGTLRLLEAGFQFFDPKPVEAVSS
jgi:hypothetical protein